jgi:glycosyltransferase involved in cell wall biosynthesis
MYRGRTIFVVIPAYNVAGHIAQVVKGVPDFVDRIVVVNDTSTDDTLEVLARIPDPRLTVRSHPTNQGVGGAMVTGFRVALEEGAGVVVKMDGDGQMDPGQLSALLDPIVKDGYAYAKGNRFLSENQLRSMPKSRLIGTFVLTFLTKLVSGYWYIFDPVNGFIAIDAAMLRRLPLTRIARRYFFETDMLIQLNLFRARIKDVDIPARYGDERSSMRLAQVVATFPLYLFQRFWYRLYYRHVLREFSTVAVFWTAGIALSSWGVAFGAFTWLHSTFVGRAATTGTVMLSALPLILGFQLILQAISIEIQESPR